MTQKDIPSSSLEQCFEHVGCQRLLLSIKIALFTSQFIMNKKEQSEIERFPQFILQYYISNRLTFSTASTAPRNNLKYLQSSRMWNMELDSVSIRTLGLHHRYLNKDLVSLHGWRSISVFEEKHSCSIAKAWLIASWKKNVYFGRKRMSLTKFSVTL